MQNTLIQKDDESVVIHSEGVGITLTEDAQCPLIMRLPTREKIKEIKAQSAELFSVNEFMASIESKYLPGIESDLQQLLSKKDVFGQSATYWNHVATLASMSHGPVAGAEYLKVGIDSCGDVFLKRKLADHLASLQKFQESATVLSQIQEKDHHVFSRLALIEVTKKGYQQALILLEKGLQICPTDFNSRLLAGALCLVTDQIPQAVRHFRVALTEDGHSSSLFLNLAFAYFKLKKPEKCRQYAKAAISLNRLNRYAVSFYADVLIGDGDYDDAIACLSNYLKIDSKVPTLPASADSGTILGTIFECLGALNNCKGSKRPAALDGRG